MMLTKFERYDDAGLLIIRVGLGLAFMFVHGMDKLFGGPSRWEQIGQAAGNLGLDFLPVLWGFMAALGEFGGGLALLLGFLYRPGLALLMGVMLTAAVSHAQGAIPGPPWHAAELGIVFLGLFFIGPGRYSVDAYFSRQRRKGF